MTRRWFENQDKQFDCQSLVVKLIDLARNRGADLEDLLRGTGVFYEDLFKQQNYLSFVQLEKLLFNAQKQVSSNDLSFLLGRRLFPNHNPDISELIHNARTLQDLLRLVSAYQYLCFPYLYLTPKHHDGKVWLLVNNAVSHSNQQTFLYEMLCTAVNATSKWHIGHQLPFHFYFRQKRPRNIYQYEENLGHRLVFDYPMDMIAIEDHWLHKQLVNSSSLVRRHHREQCARALAKVPQKTGFLQYIALNIENQGLNNLDELALALNVSPATLKRKLKQHGTSFQKVQDQLRSQTALFDLKVRQLTNEQAADSLKITNLTNFRRVIKRWTGMTPSELKAR